MTEVSNINYDKKLFHVFNDLLTKDEAKYYMKKFMNSYNENKVDKLRGSTRSYDRVIFTDFELANRLFEKIKDYIPAKFFKKHKIVRINEVFRMSRYHKNMQFKTHQDGTNVSHHDETKSFATLNIFLNEGFAGGSTIFYLDNYPKPKKTFKAEPKAGRGAFFDASIFHCGEKVYDLMDTDGKFLLRTDLMLSYNDNDNPAQNLKVIRLIEENERKMKKNNL